VLGPRLLECCQALTDLPGNDPVAVLGDIDALKLRSSMTLFDRADPDQRAFRAVLEKYYGGSEDQLTLGMLGGSPPHR
jgi:uncharacterized protein (DUF1810 family)